MSHTHGYISGVHVSLCSQPCTPPASSRPRFPRCLRLLPLHQASLPSRSCLDLVAHQVSPDPPTPSPLTTETSACMHGSAHRLCLGCIFATEHSWGVLYGLSHHKVMAQPPLGRQCCCPSHLYVFSGLSLLCSVCSPYCLPPSFQNDPFERQSWTCQHLLKSSLFLCGLGSAEGRSPCTQGSVLCSLPRLLRQGQIASSFSPFPSAWSALSSSLAHLSLHLADSYSSFKTIPPPQTSCRCYYS